MLLYFRFSFLFFLFSFSVCSFLIIDSQHLKYKGNIQFKRKSHFPLCSTIFLHIQHIFLTHLLGSVVTYQFDMLWSHAEKSLTSEKANLLLLLLL